MFRLSFVVALLAAVPLAAQVQTLTPFQQAKARTLLRDKLPCLGCHELDGSGGRSAPWLTGVGSRRGAAYIHAIITDPQRLAPTSAMPRIPMPVSTRDLIVAYLSRDASRGVTPQPVALPTAPAAAASARMDGAALYAKWCSSCHGAQGRGDGPNARYLPVPPAMHASAKEMSSRSDDMLFDAIAGGGVVMGRSARMPAFGATLRGAEIRALVAYIRVLCSCKGPSWSRDDGRR